MTHYRQSVLALLTAMVMLFAVLPTAALAQETGDVRWSGVENATVAAGEDFDCLANVSAALGDTPLAVSVVDISAEGDESFVFAQGQPIIPAAVADAVYTVTYSAASQAQAASFSVTRKVTAVNPSFQISGPNADSVAPNAVVNLLEGLSLTVQPAQLAGRYELRVAGVEASDNVQPNGDLLTTGSLGEQYRVTYGVYDTVRNAFVPNATAVRTLTVAVTVDETVKDALATDDAYLTRLSIESIADGVGPFDDTDDDGFDSAADNLLVRSFDRVTYHLAASYAVRTRGVYYLSGRIHYEMVLPYTAKQAVWDTDAMPWMEDGWAITTDANGYQTLHCTRLLETPEGQTCALPGGNTVSAVVHVQAMRDGEQLQPTFHAWMDHNTPEGACAAHGVERKTVQPQAVEISAALRLNAQLRPVGDNYFDTTVRDFDFANTGNALAINKDKGLVNGRLAAYGLTLQLYNANGRGFLGCELPSGAIQVTLDMRSNYVTNGSGTIVHPADYQPLLWSYGPSNNARQNDDGRNGGANAVPGGAPLNAMPGTPAYTCWNGGSWSASQQTDSEVTFTIRDYEINLDSLPYRDMSSSVISYYNPDVDTKDTIHIGCFSAAELWVLQPAKSLTTGEAVTQEYGNGTFSLKLEIGELTAQTADQRAPQGLGLPSTNLHESNSNQQYMKDDQNVKTIYLARSGSYQGYVLYGPYAQAYAGWLDVNGQAANRENGKDSIIAGGRFSMEGGCRYFHYDQPQNQMVAFNSLLKFDAAAIELTDGKVYGWDGIREADANGTVMGMDGAVYYGTLPDGANWTDDAQLMATREDGLKWYSSYEAIPDGHLCVAILWELRGPASMAYSIRWDPRYSVNARIRPDFTQSGHVCMLYQNNRVWTVEDVAGQLEADPAYRVPSFSSELPAQGCPKAGIDWKPDYIKAIYDAGGYIGGHKGSDNFGDSLYVVPYTSRILKQVEQKDESGAEKHVFDLDYGQRTADYALTASLELPALEGGTVGTDLTTTVTIRDELPAGLTYIPQSTVFGGTYQQAAQQGRRGTVSGGQRGEACEPVIVPGENGGTVLTWIIENVPVQAGQLPVIHYSCTIGTAGVPETDVADSALLENHAMIRTTEDNREFSELNGNLSKASIQVIKLKQIALSKTSLKKYYELGEAIGYRLNYDNNANNQEHILLLDSMPFNGDPWGSSFGGSYAMAGWQLDTARLGVSPAAFTLYYTTDTVYRGKTAEELATGTIQSWSTLPIAADGTVAWGDIVPVAFALEGDLPGRQTVQVTLQLQPENGKEGDILCNALSKGELTVQSNAYVLKRYLDGVTWLDMNADGIRQPGEALLPGVSVRLCTADGQTVVNLRGAPCIATTGSNGAYRFDALPAGSFHVAFTDGATVRLNDYFPSPFRAAGSAEWNDSDMTATTDASGKVETAVIKDVVMPTAEDMPSAVYSLRSLDAGFYARGGLTIEKQVTGTALPDADAIFTFVVKADVSPLTGLLSVDGGTPLPIPQNGRIGFKAGQKATLTGLMPGVYTVTEEAPVGSAAADFAGVTVTVDGTAGNTAVIAANGSASFVFTNTYVSSSSFLTISKTVTGNGGDPNRDFTFRVKLDAPGIFPYTGDKVGTLSDGDEITLTHGQSITITGLPVGMAYEVQEKEADRDGYRTTASGHVGLLPEGGAHAAFVNHKDTPPPTGDRSPITLWLALMDASALCGTALLLQRRRWAGKE